MFPKSTNDQVESFGRAKSQAAVGNIEATYGLYDKTRGPIHLKLFTLEGGVK
jgi:hypothetical protein